jgi:hypothetical protein
MPKIKNNYIECIKVLTELKTLYPNQTLGQHISTATSDYKDVWGLTDKEFLFALEKYSASLEFDLPSETDIQKIIAGATNEKLFELDEEEEDED